MSQPKNFIVTGENPIDDDQGRVFAPGETAKVDPDNPHNAELIEAGRLVEPAKPKPKKENDS